MAVEAIYCKDCEKCRRCEVWAEYKCIENMTRTCDPDTLACDKFKRRKGEIQKCKCDDCMSILGEVE